MKKSIFILFIISILFSFCACSNVNNIDDKTTQSTTQEQENTTTNTTEIVDNMITVKIGDKSFSAQLYDNETAQAFADMLPLTIDMNELHGNEKYYNLSNSLPMDSSDVGKINNGDIMLYGNDCLVLFYDSFSTNYSYTKIGYVKNPSELADAVGNGNITITFYK